MLESVVSARGKVLRTNFSATSRVLPPSSVGEMTLSGLLVTLDLTSDGDHLNRSGFSGRFTTPPSGLTSR